MSEVAKLKTFAVVPVKRFENAKTRLAPILCPEERIMLSCMMLEDTLSTLASNEDLYEIVVVSGDKRAKEIAGRYRVNFLNEEKDGGVNSAVALADMYCSQEGANATVVVPQDLPLLDSNSISEICKMAEKEERCIVLCPSLRFDGTNILLRKPPTAIGTHYDNDSYRMHVKTAINLGISVYVVHSPKLMFDIDTPEDATRLSDMADPFAVSATTTFLKSHRVA